MACVDAMCRSHRPGGLCDCPPPRPMPRYITGGSPDAYIIIDKAALERGEAAIHMVRPDLNGEPEVRNNFSRIRFVDCPNMVIEQLPSPQQDGTRIRLTNLGLMEVFA